MDEQEINKRALKAYPEIHEKEFSDERNLIPNAIQDARREGYTKSLKEINNLPKIEGWIARNKEPDELCFFPGEEPPTRMVDYWFAGFAWSYTKIQDTLPELTWEDEPLKVELIINKL